MPYLTRLLFLAAVTVVVAAVLATDAAALPVKIARAIEKRLAANEPRGDTVNDARVERRAIAPVETVLLESTSTSQAVVDAALPIRPIKARHRQLHHTPARLPPMRPGGGARYQHSQVWDSAGVPASSWSAAQRAKHNLSDTGSLPFHTNTTHTRAKAQELANLGHTVLHYDVAMHGQTRVLDDDLNVHAVTCAAVTNGTQWPMLLTITANNLTLAAANYTTGTVVHGSAMWQCRPPYSTILARVTSVKLVPPRQLVLTTKKASMHHALEHAQVTFKQPRLRVPHAVPVPPKTARRGRRASTVPVISAAVSLRSGATHTRHTRRKRSSRGATSSRLLSSQRRAQADLLAPTDENEDDDDEEDEEDRSSLIESLSVSAVAVDTGLAALSSDPIPFTVEVDKALYTPSSTVYVTFTPGASVKFTKALTIHLQQRHPIEGDSTIGSWQWTPNGVNPSDEWYLTSQQTWPLALNASSDSSLNSICYYSLSVSWCDSEYTHCVAENDGTETSAPFQIWSQPSSSLAWPSDGQAATNSVAYGFSCDICKQTPSASELCKLCTDDRSFSVDAKCDGCSFSYFTTVTDLYLDTTLLSNAHVAAGVTLDGIFSTTFGLTMDAGVQLQDSAKAQLASIGPIPIPDLSFSLGSFTLGVEAGFTIDIGASLDLKAAVHLQTKATMHSPFHIVLAYDTRNSPASSTLISVPTLHNGPAPTVAFSAAGEIEVELDLIPTVNLIFTGLAKATVTSTAYAKFQGNAQYPLFPALSMPYQLGAPWPAALSHPPNEKGHSCSLPHLMRFAVLGGLKDNTLSAELDYAGKTTSLGSKTFAELKLQVYSGCLFNFDAPSGQTVSFSVKVPSDVTLQTAAAISQLEQSVALDIASAAGIDMTRLAVSVSKAANTVALAVMPALVTVDPTAATLVQKVLQQVNDKTSQLQKTTSGSWLSVNSGASTTNSDASMTNSGASKTKSAGKKTKSAGKKTKSARKKTTSARKKTKPAKKKAKSARKKTKSE